VAQAITAADLDRVREWSLATFGPGIRDAGIMAHIKKEFVEIENDPSGQEWVDVVILGLDGLARHGFSGIEIIGELLEKWAVNEDRTWPDWRQFTNGEPIEHVREPHAAPGDGNLAPCWCPDPDSHWKE